MSSLFDSQFCDATEAKIFLLPHDHTQALWALALPHGDGAVVWAVRYDESENLVGASFRGDFLTYAEALAFAENGIATATR
jgi:hypothetical protein